MNLTLPTQIDSSRLSLWRSCRRKFFWSELNALYPSGKSVHLVAGGALAAGIEAARRLAFSGPGDHRHSLDDLLQAAYPAFSREWGDYEPPEKATKTFIRTFQALEEYLRSYPPQTDPIQPLIRPDGQPAVEFTFAIPITEAPSHPETGEPFFFVGRFDMLGSYNGLPCIVDEKTTSSLGFAWADQWKLRGQFMGYCWACQQLGYPVNTAAIRGIGILKNDIKIQTALEQFPEYLIQRWYTQLLLDIGEICSAWNLAHKLDGTDDIDFAFPYNFADSCTSYGGCAFGILCTAKDPEPFFSNFVKHRWDPLAKNPVKELETNA